MKSIQSALVLKSAAALAVAVALSSCADPYASFDNGPPIRDVPSYRPGYRLTKLPPGYRTETIGGSRYYTHNGTYYRSEGRGYVAVDPPRRPSYGGPDRDRDRDRDRPSYGRPPGRNDGYIDRLPPGYHTEQRGKDRYYRVGGTYYKQQGRGYQVVQRPF